MDLGQLWFQPCLVTPDDEAGRRAAANSPYLLPASTQTSPSGQRTKSNSAFSVSNSQFVGAFAGLWPDSSCAAAYSDAPAFQNTPFTPASFQLPSPAWQWASPWSVVMQTDGRTDEHGWEYNWIFKSGGWHSHVNRLGWAGYVRRRKWTRIRELRKGVEQGLLYDDDLE